MLVNFTLQASSDFMALSGYEKNRITTPFKMSMKNS